MIHGPDKNWTMLKELDLEKSLEAVWVNKMAYPNQVNREN